MDTSNYERGECILTYPFHLIRFGVYDVLKAKIKPTIVYRKGKQEKVIPAWKIASVASVAGAAGGLAGNPAGEFVHQSAFIDQIWG